MRGKYWIPTQEYLISKWEKKTAEEALMLGYSVVLDSTNLNFKYLREWVELAQYHGAEISFQRFDISVEEAIERDKKRGDESVGEEVIRRMHKNYLELDTTMAKVEEMLKNPFTIEKIVQDPSLPKAIIVDLDGTMCIHNGRGPFDYDLCHTDLVNKPILSIVAQYQSRKNKIIFLSGREDTCKEKTKLWLENAGFLTDRTGVDVVDEREYCELFMRQANDHRKDCIIKKEIFDREIKNKYFVEFCLDDRDQVVKLWRDMGLTCLQVNYGAF